jgi:cytochrome c peroxidase
VSGRSLKSVVVAAVAICLASCESSPAPWTEDEIAILESLWIGALAKLPPDPTNAVADDPRAAEFGRELFFDTRLSANGAVSCATCHQPERRFTDGLPKGVAIGMSKRNTPSIVGTAYSPWLYWDGRRDSQWAQALSPLEDPQEHGSTRADIVSTVIEDEVYRRQYEALFGNPTDVVTVFANIGKVLAAFERTVMPTASRFDSYVAAVIGGDELAQRELLTVEEVRGLRLFIGEASCTQCHNGPLFTNNEFHNTGLINFPGDLPDKGRVVGVREVNGDPFNCRGQYNDDPTVPCSELDFARTGPELIGTFRTPSLRNIADTAPYGHAGQLATLRDVLEHYNEAPDAMIGHNEAKPLGLRARELLQLEAFLATLEAPVISAGAQSP